MKRLLGAPAVALVAALSLAACGTSDTNSNPGSTSKSTSSSTSSSSSSDFNKADVTFAQSMVPHHRQAVQMAKLAKSRASSPEVKQLAAKIEAAQGPEIKTMSNWLTAWGKKVPSADMSGMGHDMGSMSGQMSGMMSDADMKKLDAATGAQFDKMFLTMMIKHHTGAVAAAKTEQSTGQNEDAVALATKIEGDQTSEIAIMRTLLQG